MSKVRSPSPMDIEKPYPKPLPFHLDTIKCVCTKPLLENLEAQLSYVELKEAGIAFSRLHTRHTKRSRVGRFNICVAHTDILEIKLSQVDNEGKRYIFFKITKNSAKMIIRALDFDIKKFDFNSADEPWIRFYFKTEPVEHLSQILPFIRHNYYRNRPLGPITVNNVSVDVAFADYDKTFAACCKAINFDSEINQTARIILRESTVKLCIYNPDRNLSASTECWIVNTNGTQFQIVQTTNGIAITIGGNVFGRIRGAYWERNANGINFQLQKSPATELNIDKHDTTIRKVDDHNLMLTESPNMISVSFFHPSVMPHKVNRIQ